MIILRILNNLFKLINVLNILDICLFQCMNICIAINNELTNTKFYLQIQFHKY